MLTERLEFVVKVNVDRKRVTIREEVQFLDWSEQRSTFV